MESQVLLTVWCNISGGAEGESWHWSLSGVKGLMNLSQIYWSTSCYVCLWSFISLLLTDELPEPPRIVDFPENDMDKPGDVTRKTGLTIPCGAKGSGLEWEWKFNDDTTKAIYKIDTKTGTLTKANVGRADDGTFQCFVKNAVGTMFSRKLKVKVTGKLLALDTLWNTASCSTECSCNCRIKALTTVGSQIPSHQHCSKQSYDCCSGLFARV